MKRAWSRSTVWLSALLALGSAACTSSHDVRPVLDAGPDADGGLRDAAARDAAARECGPGTGTLDLLLVMDNSNSMIEEQTSFIDQLPRLMNALSTGTMLDARGAIVRSATPITNMHVGVVDSDMGSGGFLVPTCADSNFGDDGILRTRGNTAIVGCMAVYPSFLEFFGPRSDVTGLVMDVTCVAALGTGGCGFEQHLEAMLKAVTPSTSSTPFAMGTRGHSDVENIGFLRFDSLLGVIVVGDEDDCSAADGDLFNQDSARYIGDLNLRCFQYSEALHPIARYVQGLLALRPEHPDRVVFASIAGAPTDLAANADPLDFNAVLADPRMQQAPDPSMPSRLTPSCNVPGRGLAFPPVRITQVARGLHNAGAHAVVQSLCQEDFTGAVDTITNRLFDALDGVCPR